MESKIGIVRKWEDLIIPESEFILQINGLIKNVKSTSRETTSATLSDFFQRRGLLVVAWKVTSNQVQLLGMATLITSVKINGTTGRLEHVSVLPEYQGRGLARQMIEKLIRAAQRAGIETIDFTSEASRIAANQLYAKIGGELRETNVWRIKIPTGTPGT